MGQKSLHQKLSRTFLDKLNSLKKFWKTDQATLTYKRIFTSKLNRNQPGTLKKREVFRTVFAKIPKNFKVPKISRNNI